MGLHCGTPPPGANHPDAAAAPAWFEDATGTAKLTFVHRSGPPEAYFMPDIMAGGCALGDFDNDDRLDVFLVHNAGPSSAATNQLFHQQTDGTFKDVSAGSGLDVAGYGQGVATGDLNNDGQLDVVLTEYGATRVFVNRGGSRFAEVTETAGVDNPLWGTSACLLDYDRDNWLDLAVVNYVEYDPTKRCAAPSGLRDFCSPASFAGTASKLYRNLGSAAQVRPAAVRFEDRSLSSGIGRLAGPGLGIACADFDGDRWPDIFVANDGQANRLWMNQGDGIFKDEAVERGIAYNSMAQQQAHMGVALGDVDADGLFDLFVTHLTDEIHTLWKQGPRGQFHDATVHAGLSVRSSRGTGFGAVLADFDNNGTEDVAYVNGRVSRPADKPPAAPDAFWTVYAESNRLFANDGSGLFRDVSAANPAFSSVRAVARGLAVGDFNNDGALDLLATSIAGPARLFRNVAPNRGHWVIVRAYDPAAKRDAYGAEVSVVAGRQRRVRWANPAFSYLCSNDPRVHVGLGAADRVDQFHVVWPDGSEEGFPGQPADRFITLTKGSGTRQAAGEPVAARHSPRQ
jgi:hypothetical protein